VLVISRIHDVYNNRILQVLSSMQLVTLHTFPEDGSTWAADEFLDKIDETCRQAAMVCGVWSARARKWVCNVQIVQELNRKSVLVEEAVEEVLSLVQKANDSVTIPKLEHKPSVKGTEIRVIKGTTLVCNAPLSF